jgi:hypothetical protein
MTYDESMEAQVTRAEALAELGRHQADQAEFFAEMGDKETYAGAAVLAWLGY